MSNRDIVIAELKRIADDNDGLLRPNDIVDAARPKQSPLHSKFEWDDSEAAEKYRLWQARQLISVTVDYFGSDKRGMTTRVFVSLTPDRKYGGYRSVETIMSDKDQRRQLLEDALKEMELFQKKYADVQELAEVFAAMKRVKKTKVAA